MTAVVAAQIAGRIVPASRRLSAFRVETGRRTEVAQHSVRTREDLGRAPVVPGVAAGCGRVSAGTDRSRARPGSAQKVSRARRRAQQHQLASGARPAPPRRSGTSRRGGDRAAVFKNSRRPGSRFSGRRSSRSAVSEDIGRSCWLPQRIAMPHAAICCSSTVPMARWRTRTCSERNRADEGTVLWSAGPEGSRQEFVVDVGSPVRFVAGR